MLGSGKKQNQNWWVIQQRIKIWAVIGYTARISDQWCPNYVRLIWSYMDLCEARPTWLPCNGSGF